MNVLSQEARRVQNAGYCAILLWRFTVGYSAAGEQAQVPLPLFFIALPLLLHEESLQHVHTTRRSSGFLLMVRKLAKNKDQLVVFDARVRAYRALTWRALGVATAAGLVTLSPDKATVMALRQADGRWEPELRERLRDAEKLGAWMSSITFSEVISLLRVAV